MSAGVPPSLLPCCSSANHRYCLQPWALSVTDATDFIDAKALPTLFLAQPCLTILTQHERKGGIQE